MAQFDVEAKLLADATGFLSGMQEATKGLQDLQKHSVESTNSIVESLKHAGEKGGEKFKEALHHIAGPAIALLTIGGISHLYKEMRHLGEEARVVEDRFKFLAKASMGSSNAAFTATERIEKYAKATSESTGIDKDAIMTAGNKIMMFKEVAKTAGEVGGTFDRVLQSSIDLQGAGFGQAAGMARMLGRAMEDPNRAAGVLRRMNIILTDSEKEKIKTLVKSGQAEEARAMILDKVEGKVKGAAVATATTSAKMKASWKNLQEEIGKALLPTYDKFGKIVQKEIIPALEKLSKVIPKVIDFFQQNKTVLVALTVGIMGAVGAYKATTTVMEVVDTLKATFTAITNAQTIATVQATAAQEGLNVAMALNPIGLVIAAVTALIGVFGIWVAMSGKVSDTFNNLRAPQVVYDAITGRTMTQNQRAVASGSQVKPFMQQVTARDLASNFPTREEMEKTGLPESAIKRALERMKSQVNKLQSGVTKALKIMANNPDMSIAEAFKKATGRDAKANDEKVIGKILSKTMDNVLQAQKVISHQKLAELLSDPQFDIMLEASSEEQRKTLITKAGLLGEEWAKAFIEGGEAYGSKTTGLQSFLNPIIEADTVAEGLAKEKADAIKSAKESLTAIVGGLQAVAMATREIGQNEQATIDQIAAIRQSVQELHDAGGMTQAVYDQDVKFIENQAKSIEMIQQKRDEIQATIAQARDYISTTVQGLMAEADVTKMGGSVKEITDNLNTLLARQFDFRQNLSKLKNMGLDTGVMQELVNAGSEAGNATAKILAEGGQAAVDSVNSQFTAIKELNQTTGEMMAQTMYGAGVDSTDGLIKGLRSKDAELYKQAQGLGKIIKDGVLHPNQQKNFKNPAETIMSSVNDILGKPTGGQTDFSSGVNPYATTVTNNFTVVGSQDPVTTSEVLFQRFNAGFIGGQP